MEYTDIPGTPFKPSRIGLGTWAIGGRMWGGTDEEQSVRTIFAALNKGVTLIDTAPAYGFGRSENIVGHALAEYGGHDDVVLATKAGLEWDDHGNVRRNASGERIMQEIDDSLRRLRTDHIHLYQVHWPDPRVPVEETAAAMERLLREGKIGAIGVSNFSPGQIDAFRAVAPVHVVQPPYNLFERGIEADVLPYCQNAGIATLTYGVLCRGMLSGRMSASRRFEGDDLRNTDPKFRPPRFGQYLAAAEALERLARERFGRSLLGLAVRWVLDQPGVSVALWGGRRPDQMDPLDEATGWNLDVETRQEIDRIISAHVADPVGPEFMAPPARDTA